MAYDDDEPVNGDGPTVMASPSFDEMMRRRGGEPEEESERTIAQPGLMPEGYGAPPPATGQGYGQANDNPRTVALTADQWPGMGPLDGQNSDMPRTVALPSGEFPMPDYGAAPSYGNQGQSGDVPRTIALDAHNAGNYPMPAGGGYPQQPQPQQAAQAQPAPQEEDAGMLKIVLIGAAVFVMMGGMAAAVLIWVLR